MAFSDTQARQLKAKLDSQNVKTRKANGATLHYIEGWHAIAEANRIFGYDAWDRRTLATRCVWTGTNDQHYLAAYIAKVRIRVRAGDTIVVREGSGTGEGRALTPGQAHELALKTAETDATKRALATFGNPFGLALYDREQTGVRQRPNGKTVTEETAKGPWMLRLATGTLAGSFDTPDAFATALRGALTKAEDIERLFGVWEQNVATVRALNRSMGAGAPGFAQSLVAHLKSCAIASVKPNGETGPAESASDADPVDKDAIRKGRCKIDKSVLTFGEPKRHRSKEHLRFVASQPCLICGRVPSHAHHIRYAQSRGLALKVSDEFTVPLCAIHHAENHTTGDERPWWEKHNIDPLPLAEGLWLRSQRPMP